MAHRIADNIRLAGANFRVSDVTAPIRQEYGGDWVYVGKRGDIAARDQQIAAATRAGRKSAEIARDFGLSVRQVDRIKRTNQV